MRGTPEQRFAARMAARAARPAPPPRPAYTFRIPATPGSLAHLRRVLRSLLHSQCGDRLDVGRHTLNCALAILMRVEATPTAAKDTP